MVKKLDEYGDHLGTPQTPRDWLSVIRPGVEGGNVGIMDEAIENAHRMAENVQSTPYGEVYEYKSAEDPTAWSFAVIHPKLGVLGLNLGGDVVSSSLNITSPIDGSGISRVDWVNEIRDFLADIHGYLSKSNKTPTELKTAMQTRSKEYGSLLAHER